VVLFIFVGAAGSTGSQAQLANLVRIPPRSASSLLVSAKAKNIDALYQNTVVKDVECINWRRLARRQLFLTL
jgi:hypothetical protein